MPNSLGLPSPTSWPLTQLLVKNSMEGQVRSNLLRKRSPFGNDLTHIYVTPACSFWEQLCSRIRLLKGYLKNGTIDYVMDQVCTTLASMAEEIQQWHPAPCEVKQLQKLEVLIDKLLSENLVKYANGALFLINDCLARAIKEHGKEPSRKYGTFGKCALWFCLGRAQFTQGL